MVSRGDHFRKGSNVAVLCSAASCTAPFPVEFIQPPRRSRPKPFPHDTIVVTAHRTALQQPVFDSGTAVHVPRESYTAPYIMPNVRQIRNYKVGAPVD